MVCSIPVALSCVRMLNFTPVNKMGQFLYLYGDERVCDFLQKARPYLDGRLKAVQGPLASSLHSNTSSQSQVNRHRGFKDVQRNRKHRNSLDNSVASSTYSDLGSWLFRPLLFCFRDWRLKLKTWVAQESAPPQSYIASLGVLGSIFDVLRS